MAVHTVLACWAALLMTLAGGALAPMSATAQTAYGTAFAVTADGDLVTNEHVVSGCTRIDAQLGRSQFTGEVKVHDQRDDLAIVRLNAKPPGFAVLREQPTLSVGDFALTYGYPLAFSPTSGGELTIGYISALHGPGGNRNYIEITTPVQHGNSGGPLLDISGHVIGVAAKLLVPLGSGYMNLAIDLDTLRKFLSQNDIKATEQESLQQLRPPDIGDQAKLFSYLIRCIHNNATTAVQTIPVPSGTSLAPTSERAVLYEEEPKPLGRSFAGSVTWRLEMLQPEGAHSPIGTIHADIRIEDRINAVLTLSRTPQFDGSTADRAKIEFRSKNREEGDITSVAGMVTKLNAQAKAIPIIAAPFQGERNTFFLEFTNDAPAVQQNLRLLRDQTLLDILFVHKDGRRGVISLTKGVSGTSVINQAIGSWLPNAHPVHTITIPNPDRNRPKD